MPISIITGVPGGGKSYRVIREIRRWLRYFPNHQIRTNLSGLSVEKLHNYMRETYPDECIDVMGRVIPIADDTAGRFFLTRPNCVVSETSNPDLPLQFNFEGPVVPVLYIIDEAHLFYSSREYAKLAKTFQFYLSQHRKFSDEIIFVTQHPKNIDTFIRRLTSDYYICENWSKMKRAGFTLPRGFRCCQYYGEPTGSVDPVDTSFYQLDKKLADCYDSSSGVGISQGSKLEQNVKSKGLPWYVFPLGVVGLAALGIYGVEYATRAGLTHFNHAITPVSRSTAAPMLASGPSAAPMLASGPSAAPTPSSGPSAAPTPSSGPSAALTPSSGPSAAPIPVYCIGFYTGFDKTAGKLVVLLSDGSKRYWNSRAYRYDDETDSLKLYGFAGNLESSIPMRAPLPPVTNATVELSRSPRVGGLPPSPGGV